ncbi:MAG: molybdenum cofactor biosynthesis protein MoaE [Spirochaetaceae bacterium]
MTRNIDVDPLFSHEPLEAKLVAEVLRRWQVVSGLGGLVTFLGQVRADAHPEGTVTGIEFTAHEEMATAAVRELAEEVAAEAADPLFYAYVRHRLGRVPVGAYPVLIVVGTGHRDRAYRASRRLIDGLKERAPIFGRELLDAGGHRWKEG